MAASVIALTGCLGSTPEPAPTRTAVFSSEEEAFAAAEETYRAYIDAVNARWAGDQESPAPERFLVGEALDAEIDVQREFEELGVHIVGETGIEFIEPVRAYTNTGDVVIEVCVNSENSAVLNDAQVDVTPDDRPPRVLVRATLVPVGDQLLIEQSVTAREDGC